MPVPQVGERHGSAGPACNVLIVGAGPAGAALAVALGRTGLRVRLIEASVRFERQFRGEALMPSGLEALTHLGLGDPPIGVPRKALGSWSFYCNGKRLFTAQEPLHGTVPCTLIDQASLLRWMVTQADRCPGVSLMVGRPVVELIHEADRVVGVILSDGTRLRADLVVGCDGRGSQLRRRSRLPFTRSRSAIDVLWFRLLSPWSDPVAEWLGDQFVTCVGEGRSFALFRTASGAVQLGWALDRREGEADPPEVPSSAAGGESWQELWASCSPPDLRWCLRALPDGAIEGPLFLPVQVGLAERWHAPGLLLLGDAAHPMSPLRAQGINMALRDAASAAALLLPWARSTVAGGCSPVLLEAALAQIETIRKDEVRTIQALQAREASRARRLQRTAWLRWLLVRAAPRCSTLMEHRWSEEQRTLRRGARCLPASTGTGGQDGV